MEIQLDIRLRCWGFKNLVRGHAPGYAVNQSLDIPGNNDYLMILFDFGLIGFFVFIWLILVVSFFG